MADFQDRPQGASAFVPMKELPPDHGRVAGSTLVLFDVDETLTKARRGVTPEMVKILAELRKKVAIGFVGGSNLAKIREQLEALGGDGEPLRTRQ